MEKNTALLNDSLASSESVQTEKYLTYFIENQLFAFKSSEVVEIIRMQPITFVPKLPPFVKGVINLRGKIVPLIDLRLKLGKPAVAYDEQTSIIVSEAETLTVGFIVDKVNDVTDISKTQISESPKLAHDSGNHFVTGIATLDGAVALILDVMQLLLGSDSDIKSGEPTQPNSEPKQ